MGLVYWRLYVTQGLLSYLFGLDEANVSREISGRLRPLLLDVLPTPMRDGLLLGAADRGAADRGAADRGAADRGAADRGAADRGAERPRKPGKKIATLADLLAAYPEVAEVLAEEGAFVDATEQEVPKPKTKTHRGDPKPAGKAARKMRYSGKQKCYTVKTQVLTTKRLVLHVLGGLPGSVSDTTLLRASGVLRRLPPGTRARVDRGYEGAEAEYPEAAVEKPVRGQRGHTLTALGRGVQPGGEPPAGPGGTCAVADAEVACSGAGVPGPLGGARGHVLPGERSGELQGAGAPGLGLTAPAGRPQHTSSPTSRDHGYRRYDAGYSRLLRIWFSKLFLLRTYLKTR